MLRLILSVFVAIFIPCLAAAEEVNPASRSPLPATLPVKWTPMPIRSEHQAQRGMAGGEGGQCLHGICRSPADDNRIYICVDVVGTWRSRDAGATWQPCRQKGFYSLGTSSIAVSPKNADELLVYADSPDWDTPRLQEEGIYRSTDAGESFTRVLTVPNEDPRRAYRHQIDYASDGKRVYAMPYTHGVFRSDDGGETWTGPLALKGLQTWEIRVDPRNADVVWAATTDGLQVSRDAGRTFNRVAAFRDFVVTAVSPDPLRAGRVYVVEEAVGLFRSDDDGKSFARIPTGDKDLDSTCQGFFQSPADPQRMILSNFSKLRTSIDSGRSWAEGKVDYSNSFVQQGGWAFGEGFSWSYKKAQQVVGALSCGMYASEDAGHTWGDSMTGYDGFHHGWSDGAVTFAATDAKRFGFFCYDYAFVYTTDGGRTFTRRGLKQKVAGWWGMYVGDMSPTWAKKPVVVAAAGNYWKNELVRSDDAGESWTTIPNTAGTYFFVRFHPNEPDVVYADDRRSDDAGKSFKKLAHPVYAFAPSHPNTVYGYGEGKVWRSDNRGDTWTALPAPPDKAGDFMGRRALQVDPKNPNRIFVMTPPDCAIFDGKKWTSIPASSWVSPRAHPYVNRLAIDPDNSNRMILGLDAIGTSYLYLSDNDGVTWFDITGNLPLLGPNQSLDVQPGTGRIFMGAGFGTLTCTIPKAP